MPIAVRCGNIFDSDAQSLVNPVNAEGIMGKGLALEFKKRYPACFEQYNLACRRDELQVGKVLVQLCEEASTGKLRQIISFPTKQSWRKPSKLEWIVSGLQSLRGALVEHNINSVAIPALGAGLGGLWWPDVRYCIERELAGLDIEFEVYAPQSA